MNNKPLYQTNADTGHEVSKLLYKIAFFVKILFYIGIVPAIFIIFQQLASGEFGAIISVFAILFSLMLLYATLRCMEKITKASEAYLEEYERRRMQEVFDEIEKDDK